MVLLILSCTLSLAPAVELKLPKLELAFNGGAPVAAAQWCCGPWMSKNGEDHRIRDEL